MFLGKATFHEGCLRCETKKRRKPTLGGSSNKRVPAPRCCSKLSSQVSFFHRRFANSGAKLQQAARAAPEKSTVVRINKSVAAKRNEYIDFCLQVRGILLLGSDERRCRKRGWLAAGDSRRLKRLCSHHRCSARKGRRYIGTSARTQLAFGTGSSTGAVSGKSARRRATRTACVPIRNGSGNA